MSFANLDPLLNMTVRAGPLSQDDGRCSATAWSMTYHGPPISAAFANRHSDYAFVGQNTALYWCM